MGIDRRLLCRWRGLVARYDTFVLRGTGVIEHLARGWDSGIMTGGSLCLCSSSPGLATFNPILWQRVFRIVLGASRRASSVVVVIIISSLGFLAAWLVFVVRMFLLVVLSQQFRLLDKRSLGGLVRASEGEKGGDKTMIRLL